MNPEDFNKKPEGAMIKDVGAKAIDFGTGSAKSTPAPSSPSRKRPEAESFGSEFESFNAGSDPSGLGLNVSSKQNGGQKPGKTSQTGM